MIIPKDNAKLSNAKRLRKEMTPHERKLWYLFLQKYPIKVYKQRIIGNYIVDFYCAKADLIIELDGSQHYEDKEQKQDLIRNKFLENHGLKVLRFPNSDIDRNFPAVCEQIHTIIQERLQKT